MDNNLATTKSPGEAEITPGPLYPDRCLECVELWDDTYGGIRHNRCVDCVSASRAVRNKTTAVSARDRAS